MSPTFIILRSSVKKLKCSLDDTVSILILKTGFSCLDAEKFFGHEGKVCKKC